MVSFVTLVANIFAVSTVMLALSFGFLGYVDAKPQGSSTALGNVNCNTIQRQINAQTPHKVCDSCTKRIRALTVCDTNLIVHDCKNTCEESKTTIDFYNCNGNDLVQSNKNSAD
ncbi:hypothetical protein ACROYT_G002050 [Oculina patagonica]